MNTPDEILAIEHKLQWQIGRILTDDESADLFDYLSEEDCGNFFTPIYDLNYLMEVMGY